MRITFGMSASTSLRNIQLNQERLSNIEGQLTSGSRLSKPSDDPIAVARAMGFQESIDQSKQYLKNIDQGTAWLNQADSTLGGVTADLHRARELTVQAANGTLSPADKSAIQLEIGQLQQSVLDLSHAKVGAYYIFSGNKSDQPGYISAASSAVTPAAYQGNNAAVSREVSPGVTIGVNAHAQATFDPIFAALARVQDGLTTGDNAKLQLSLTELDTALDAINVTRAEVGAKSNRLEALGTRQEAVSTNLTGLLSMVKDVDMADAITSFTMAQTVYQASLKSAAQAMQPSLLDFLH